MIGDDVLHMTVQELGKLLQERKISPVELTEATLARLEQLGPKLGAVAAITRALWIATQAPCAVALGRLLAVDPDHHTL